MACEKFIISIYDTSLIAVGGPEPINFAGKGTVQLLYDGGDDKLINLFNSRLAFSLEVPLENSTEDLYYEDLFTGDEYKYKVVVTNENAAILWSGFMLPDSYNEPYTTGTFYVNFLATDGIGKLKGKLLDKIGWYKWDWYEARHSIIKAIADCLQLTNLELEIKVDPSIENEIAGRRLDKVFVNGGTWFDAAAKRGQSAYDILEDLITEIGCVLFQQDNYWYIMGINTRSAAQTVFNRYDYLGVYIADTINNINHGKYVNWNASPQVALVPPYKEIIINTGLDDALSLFPKDIVRQDWQKQEALQSPPPVSYWKPNSPAQNPVQLTARLGNEKWEVNNDWPTYQGNSIKLTGVLAADVVTHIPSENTIMSNYLSLKKPVYVNGGEGETLDVKINIKTWWPIPANHDWVNTVDNDIIRFAILLDGVVIASNKPGYTGRENYFLENYESIIAKNGFTNSEITSVFDFTDVEIPSNGYLDFHFYHPGDAEGAGVVSVMEYYAISELEIKYNPIEGKTFTKRREIDFTKTKELSIKHGDTVLSGIDNNFIIQELIPETELDEIPTIGAGVIPGHGHSLRIDGGGYFSILLANKDSLYFRRITSDYPEYLNEVELFIKDGNYYIRIVFPDGHLPNIAGELLVRPLTAGDPQTPAYRDYRESWKKSTNDNGYDRYGNVLAELMHDIHHHTMVTMEGTSKRMVWPLDMIRYNFNNKVKSFVPTRLTLTPGENETKVTAIEYINENVQDYE